MQPCSGQSLTNSSQAARQRRSGLWPLCTLALAGCKPLPMPLCQNQPQWPQQAELPGRAPACRDTFLSAIQRACPVPGAQRARLHAGAWTQRTACPVAPHPPTASASVPTRSRVCDLRLCAIFTGCQTVVGREAAGSPARTKVKDAVLAAAARRATLRLHELPTEYQHQTQQSCRRQKLEARRSTTT